MLLSGYFKLEKDLPKPIWRYPGSYISLQNFAIQVRQHLSSYCRHFSGLLFMIDRKLMQIRVKMQGLFKNDYPGLMFQNLIGPNGKPSGPDLSGEYVLKHVIGITSKRSKWGDLIVICAMIVIYRLLFLLFIKLSESLRPRLKARLKGRSQE